MLHGNSVKEQFNILLMKIFQILLISLISLTACTAGIYEPSPAELAAADYGPQPDPSSLPDLVQEYFKSSDLYDPKGVLVEKCSKLYEGWKPGPNPEYNRPNNFIYGWKTDCDINPKDSSGAYIGAIWETYFIKNGKVIDGYIPQGYKPIFE